MAAYLVLHHGAFWFQIRVPRALVARYGTLIRQNLQTTDIRTAQPLAYQLAAQWLTRFTLDRTEAAHPSGRSPFPDLTSSESDFLPSHAQIVPRRHNPVADSSQADLTPPAERSPATPDLAGSIDKLLGYWRETHPEAVASTYREFASVVKEFKKTVRKRPDEIQRTDIAAYRDRLMVAGKARATVSKRVGLISTLLQTAYDAGALPQNVARGIRIPKPKIETFSRRAFSTAELEKVFSSPVYTSGKRHLAGGGEAAAWVPMIALATGARLEEICQLQTADIIIDESHGPLMRVTDEGEGQRVKTSGSRRVIPLHRDLVKAGFLEYHEIVCESGHEWLFPALEPDHDGRRGGNLGKWFARYLRSSRGCGILDKRVVFHSFRHLFKSLCREAGISEEVHDALTGHVNGSVGRGYGHVPISVLVDAVARIEFPIRWPHIEY